MQHQLNWQNLQRCQHNYPCYIKLYIIMPCYTLGLSDSINSALYHNSKLLPKKITIVIVANYIFGDFMCGKEAITYANNEVNTCVAFCYNNDGIVVLCIL